MSESDETRRRAYWAEFARLRAERERLRAVLAPACPERMVERNEANPSSPQSELPRCSFCGLPAPTCRCGERRRMPG